MARTKRSAKLDTRTARLSKVKIRGRATETLGNGRYLLYRRSSTDACGVWSARMRCTDGTMPQERLGIADDYLDANGISVLTYAQAVEAAGRWFDRMDRLAVLRETGEEVFDGELTVGMCVARMIEEIKRRGRDWKSVESHSRRRLLPVFGDVEVAKLTKRRIELWIDEVSGQPRLRTGKGVAEEAKGWGRARPVKRGQEVVMERRETPTPEQLRARKSSANRVLAILKRALNLAVEEGTYQGVTPWRDVKPFPGVVRPRQRFLSVAESVRLVNACEDADFRRLVEAALLTGARSATLGRLRVGDFDQDAGTVWIARDKGRGADTHRHIQLTEEGAEWFTSQTVGRAADDLLLPCRGGEWKPGVALDLLREACAAADIAPLTFHELRHTYASMLVNAGVPLVYVAAQLGHKDTRMVEKFYGHLCPDAKREAIRTLVPTLGLNIPKVAPLAVKRKRA